MFSYSAHQQTRLVTGAVSPHVRGVQGESFRICLCQKKFFQFNNQPHAEVLRPRHAFP